MVQNDLFLVQNGQSWVHLPKEVKKTQKNGQKLMILGLQDQFSIPVPMKIFQESPEPVLGSNTAYFGSKKAYIWAILGHLVHLPLPLEVVNLQKFA